MVKIFEQDEKGNFVNVAEKEKITVFEQLILNMPEEEFWECNLTPYDASLYVNINTHSCIYYGQEFNLTDEAIETLAFIAKDKGNTVNTHEIKDKFKIEFGSVSTRVKRLNKEFYKMGIADEIIINNKKITGYYLNTNIVNPLRLMLIDKEETQKE